MRGLIALVVAGCGACSSGAGTPDLAPALACAPPLTVTMTASTGPGTTGVPVGAVTWAAGQCGLDTDERDPALVLVVADFTGTPLAYLTASPANDWNLTDASIHPGPAPYLVDVPRGQDIVVHLQQRKGGAAQVALTFRVDGELLTLLDMHLE